MLSISLQTKGDLRLREYAKYIKNDKNLGVDSVTINKVIKTETKKLTGKTAVSGTVQKRDNTLDSTPLLVSINKMRNAGSELTLDDINNTKDLLVGLKSSPKLFAEYKENTSHFQLNTTGRKLKLAHSIPITRYTTNTLDLRYANDSITTNLTQKYGNNFLSRIANSKIIAEAIANSLDINKKRSVNNQVTLSIPEPVSISYLTNAENKEKFLSGAQLTLLVRKKLLETSGAGKPFPPNLKTRTGTNFIASVEVSPNYRNQVMRYMYNPLLDSLNAYGYNPDAQVRRSIRQVLQQYYKGERTPETRFTLTKRGG